MNKLAQAVEERAIESTLEASADSDPIYLKKRTEDEIRMKLDRFAKELSQVKRRRNEH